MRQQNVYFQKSNNAFLVESEVNLGSFITSKASLTYLFENDPLHLLAGLHLQFNDFVMQAGHTLDFSQSNRGVILVIFFFFFASNIGNWNTVFLFSVYVYKEHY